MTHLKASQILVLTLIFTCLILSILFLNSNSSYNKTEVISLRSESTEDAVNYPGAFVQSIHPIPSNTSYCNFNYGMPTDLNPEGFLENGPELGKDSKYKILYNVIEAKINGYVPSITYATHVTADFVSYLPELVRYWDGLISVTAFVPDTDVALVLEQVNQYCYCLPGMSRVSVHLVFHKGLPPSRKDVYFTPPLNCKVEDSSKLQPHRNFDEKVIYPINVMRNAARTAALTETVVVSDIQLIPSEGLAVRFWEMMDTYKFTECPHRVYVLPIFEVESTEEIPRTKKQLVELIHDEKAVYFHKLICGHCQKFPGIENWMESDPGDKIKPLLTARREIPYHRWEPIYIGSKSEPLYNEKLSWEGLQDKMLQMLEMCLLGYKFVILDGAFLVHWPGMKKTKTTEGEAWRDDFIKQNAIEYNIELKRISKEYKPNPQCKLQ